MGLSLIDKIERIFNRQTNFDIQGFCNPDLVTSDLVEEIITMPKETRKEMLKLGYGFSWFRADASDGIIYKTIENGVIRYTLKLYYNRNYPKEIELVKKQANKKAEKETEI